MKDGDYSLFVDYYEMFSGGEICSGDEDASWPNYEPSHTEFKITSDAFIVCPNKIYTALVHCSFDPEEHIGKNIYVVVVRYQTGDSFGTSHGRWEMEGGYLTKEEAAKVKESINDNTYEGYKSWKGYFEALEDVEIHELKIVKEK